MTLDKLLAISSADWDKLSDAELSKILSPYFAVTKPNPIDVAAQKASKADKKAKSSSNIAELIRLARELGVNVPDRKP